MSFSSLSHYISSGTSLLLSRSPFLHHLIGCPNIYAGFQKVPYEALDHCGFVEPQCSSWRSPYQNQNNLDYLQIKIVKVNPQRNSNIVVPTVCSLSKYNLYKIMHQHFVHVSITRLKLTARKVIMKGLPTNIPGLEYP